LFSFATYSALRFLGIRLEVPVMPGSLPIEQDVLGVRAATSKYQFGPPANNLAIATRATAPIVAAAIL
jgi:hypothetical protein